MKLHLLALLAVLFSTPALSVPAPIACVRNFYVATTGADSPSCGAQSSPCATIQGANDNIALQGGDCVNVAAGTYNTYDTIGLSHGGNANSATGYVTYIGAPYLGSVINFAGAAPVGLVMTASYIIVDGFEFNGNSLVQYGGLWSGVSQTLAGQTHHLMILNNLIHDMGGCAACFEGGDYYIIAGNIAHDNAFHSEDGESGFSIYEPAAVPGFSSPLAWDNQYFHIQVFENVSYHNGCLRGDPNCLMSDGNGIIMDDFNLTQWPNNSLGPYPYHALIQANLTVENAGRGIQIGPDSDNVDVFNNTSYNNNVSAADGGTCRGEVSISGGNNNNVVNNLLYAVPTQTGAITDYNSGICWSGMPSDNDAFYNNLTFNGLPGQPSVTVGETADDTGNLTTVFAYNRWLGTDPKLANVNGYDFHPLPGSPALGTGMKIFSGPPYSLYTVDGLLQPNPPNIGGYNQE